MNKEKTLLVNIIDLLIIQGLNYLLPFIALPFLFRTLGATMYGIVATSYSFYMFCNIIIDFGYNLSATREISMHINSKGDIDKIVSITLASKIVITILCLLGATIIIESIPNYREYNHVFYLMMGIPIANCFFPIWYFQGVEKMGYMTLTTTLAKVLSFIPMFIIVRSKEDILYVAILYSLGYVLSSIVSIVLLKIRFNVKFVPVSPIKIVDSIKKSAPFFLSRISASLYSLGNTLVLSAMCGSQMAGLYDVAQKLIEAFNGLISPISQALYPYMIKTKNIQVIKKFLYLGTCIGLVSFFICVIGDKFLLELLYGEISDFTVKAFKILSICLLFIIPNYLMGYPFLAAMGHIKYTNYTVIFAGFYYLCVISVLISCEFINIVTVASLYVSCHFIVLVFRIFGIKKYNLFK